MHTLALTPILASQTSKGKSEQRTEISLRPKKLKPMQLELSPVLTKTTLTCALLVCFSRLATGDGPNVLFIAVDDLRVELGCYGDKHVISPNIDELASNATIFERAYCQQTVCNPSRASVLTGMRPDRLRIWDLPTHFRERNPDIVTLPQLFKQTGYHSQCIGKIFHNWRQDSWKGDEASWSVPSVLHYNSHSHDAPLVDGQLPPNLASGKGGLECRDVPDAAYFDGRIADLAMEALDAASKSPTPFFLAVGFWKPHTPFNAPKKYWYLYQREQIPVPENISPPKGIPDIALTSARISTNISDEELREIHHGHLAAISYLDAQVGKVLSKLDEIGLRDETIVVFWSDHGLHLGEHGLTRKTTAFELDAQVPLIIRVPEALLANENRPPKSTRSIVELVDIYPTLAQLCKLNVPHALEGDSLVPLLENHRGNGEPFAMTQTTRPSYPKKGAWPDVMGYSLRTENYRLTQWRDFRTGELKDEELYSHVIDSRETQNLAASAEYEVVKSRLATILDREIEPIDLDSLEAESH